MAPEGPLSRSPGFHVSVNISIWSHKHGIYAQRFCSNGTLVRYLSGSVGGAADAVYGDGQSERTACLVVPPPPQGSSAAAGPSGNPSTAALAAYALLLCIGAVGTAATALASRGPFGHRSRVLDALQQDRTWRRRCHRRGTRHARWQAHPACVGVYRRGVGADRGWRLFPPSRTAPSGLFPAFTGEASGPVGVDPDSPCVLGDADAGGSEDDVDMTPHHEPPPVLASSGALTGWTPSAGTERAPRMRGLRPSP